MFYSISACVGVVVVTSVRITARGSGSAGRTTGGTANVIDKIFVHFTMSIHCITSFCHNAITIPQLLCLLQY